LFHDAGETIERGLVGLTNARIVKRKVDRECELQALFHRRDLRAELGAQGARSLRRLATSFFTVVIFRTNTRHFRGDRVAQALSAAIRARTLITNRRPDEALGRACAEDGRTQNHRSDCPQICFHMAALRLQRGLDSTTTISLNCENRTGAQATSYFPACIAFV
jgi:hypothetical protein